MSGCIRRKISSFNLLGHQVVKHLKMETKDCFVVLQIIIYVDHNQNHADSFYLMRDLIQKPISYAEHHLEWEPQEV